MGRWPGHRPKSVAMSHEKLCPVHRVLCDERALQYDVTTAYTYDALNRVTQRTDTAASGSGGAGGGASTGGSGASSVTESWTYANGYDFDVTATDLNGNSTESI